MTNKTISPAQAQAWLASGEAILIDVREPDEFKSAHIPYALSLPLGGVCDSVRLLNIPPDRKIIFQCLRGTRGEQACAVIGQTGMACEAYNMAGGIDGWRAAGLPVVASGGEQRLSIFRQVQIIAGSLIALATLIGFGGASWGFALAGFFGAALAFAGLTGWCGMAILLAKAPWNRG